MELSQPVQDYKPRYNEHLIKTLLSHYKSAPDTFNAELVEQIKQDAQYYGLDSHIDTDITLGGVLKQAGAGFVTGFTTFNVGEEPENVAERISRNIGNLAGFVGYVPALPTKAGVLAKAATAIRGKSVPMLISGKVTESVRKIASDATRDAIAGRAGAFKTMSEFLQKGPVKNTLEGAFHLGVASSVSSWQGGVDEMMHAFIGGAQTGAAFRLIGNFLRVEGAGIPRMGAKWGELTEAQQAERGLKMLASSLYTGLPATLRGETMPEQIYEYLLGAYFGKNETPGEQRTRDKQIVKMVRQPRKENPNFLPELSPGWEKLSPREQKLVRKERDLMFNEAGEVISTKAMDLLNQSYHLPELKEESGRRPEMPKASTDAQYRVKDSVLTGKDINKEAWKNMNSADKEFYAEAIDAGNVHGLYHWYQVKKWTRPELETVAGHYKIKNIKNLSDKDLGLEIMFAQQKRNDGYNQVISDANKNDTEVVHQQEAGETVKDISVDRRSTSFAKQFLMEGFENLPPADKTALIASNARKIELEVQDIMTRAEAEGKSPDSREFMGWAEVQFGAQKFNENAHNMVRQWFKLADPVNVKQVPFISARFVGSLDKIADPDFPEMSQRMMNGKVYLDELATSGTPVDMMGNKKLMKFPKNRLDLVAEELIKNGEMPKEDVYAILDNMIISNTQSGMSQKSLYRYKEWLEQELAEGTYYYGPEIIDYKGNAKTEASRTFYKHMYDIMYKMATEKKMHYFGGSGDKERGYFVKEHPSVEVPGTRFERQLNEIITSLAGNKKGRELLEMSREQYIEQFFVTDAQNAEIYLEWKKNKNEPNMRNALEEFRILHDRAFVSNFLWDMNVNGFKMPNWASGKSTVQERLRLMSYATMPGMINTPREYNKRAQIWNTNGFKVEDKFISDGLAEYGKLALSPVTYNPDGSVKSKGGYRFLILKDELYEKHIEGTDGAITMHDKVMELEAREAGMAESGAQGQSKSFIISPHAEYGAMLGKYMKHSAGETLSKAMEEYVDPVTKEVGVHMLVYESAAKQLGPRSKNMGVADLVNGKLVVKDANNPSQDTRVFRFRPSEQHVVLSEVQNKHNIEPHSIPTQPLSSLTNSTLHTKVSQRAIDDMLSTLMHESYYTNERYHRTVEDLRQNPRNTLNIEKFFKEFHNIGINDVVEILGSNRYNHIHDRIYQHIARITRKNEEEISAEGERSQSETAEYYNFVSEFQSPAERLTNIGAKIGGEHSVPVLSTLLGKDAKPWMETVLSKYIIEKATRPVVKNSISARMRPYDFRMRQKIDLKEHQFYLDEYFRNTPIISELKERSLGTIWDKFEATRNGASLYSQKEMMIADGIFRALNLRVPMDSISGGRVLEFKGFTNRKGHGVLLHPKVMRALGGADLDGDKAHIFFGGRSDKTGLGEGMKQSWLDMYEANQGEFTRYRRKKRDGSFEVLEAVDYNKLKDKKGWEKYTFDNKDEVILHGPDKGQTSRSIFTVNESNVQPDIFKAIDGKSINQSKRDKGFMYYSPWARQRMSEAAAMGRFTLGNVVILKKTLAGAHNTIAARPDGKESIVIPFGMKGQMTYDIVPKTDAASLALFRQLARTGVALGSDPMNEIGLKSMTTFRDKLWDSIFEIKNAKYNNFETGEVSPIKKTSDFYKKWFVNPDTRHQSIYQGIFHEFSKTNNAYFGKDWRDGKQHSLYARQLKASNLAQLPEGYRNSVLPKLAHLLDPLRMEESLLKRMDKNKIQSLYEWFETQSSNKALNRLKFMLERTGFTVKPKEDYMNLVFERELWKRGNREDLADNQFAFVEFFGYKTERDGTFNAKNAISHAKLEFNHPTKPKEKLSFLQTIGLEKYEGYTGKTDKQWREYHLEELVKKTEHFIENDIRDMVSVKQLYEVIKKHKFSQKDVQRVTSLASTVRALDRQMQSARTVTTGEVDGKTGQAIHKLAKRDFNIEGKEPSATHQADIEAYVLQAKKGMTPAEQELFDTFIMGSLHRSDRKLVEDTKKRLLAGGVKMNDVLERVLEESASPTSKTSMNSFALRNSRVSDVVLEKYIKDTNDLYNYTMELPTTKELKEFEINAKENFQKPQKVKGNDNKPVQVELFEDPTIHLKGLREASKKTLDKEGEKIWKETEDHLTYYHNSVGKHLPEIVEAITGKEINTMNYEDWRNVNRFFKSIRTESIWDRFFSSIDRGKPEIMKRYFHLFPETVNHRLMLHDFILMDKAQIVMRKDGTFRNKIVKMPTHQLGKEVYIMGSIQHSMASANESEINDFNKELNPLLESNKEAYDIYEIAAREMELNYGKSLLDKAVSTGDKALEIRAQVYFKNYNQKKASVDFDALMNKVYKVPIKSKDGTVESKSITGEQYKDRFIDVLDARNKKNYEFQIGKPEYLEMFAKRDSEGRIQYFNPKDKKKEDFIRYDLDKVHKFIMEHVARGRNIPKDFGVWLVNGMVREYQYESAKTPEQRLMISQQRIRRPEAINSRHYFPHVIMDVKKSQNEMMSTLKHIVNKEEPSEARSKKIQNILMNHHLRTGDWLTPEIRQWDLFDTVKYELEVVGKKVSQQQNESYLRNSKPGFMEQRSIDMDGWTIEPRAYETYQRQLFGTMYRNLGQMIGRRDLDIFVDKYKNKWGEELTEAWRKYMTIYINNASGFPANLPAHYLEDPYLNVKGTPYAWWADNNVVNKVNKVLETYNMTEKDVPKELRGITYENIKNWSNLEAKWQLAALLAHPKTAVGNLYGGSALTIANTGWNNFKNARSIEFLRNKLNPGKDEFGNTWNSMADINQYIHNLGVMPEMIQYEMNLNPEVKRANANNFIKAAIKKIERDPEVKDSTLRGMMKEYGVSDSFWNKAAYFMRTSERVLRRDSFMAHLIQAWQNYGGALPFNHPVLIEHAKRGVKATQFLYNAPYRPMFAQTQLGKVLTRFQLWSWNSVRFRNDVLREAAQHGFREGTVEYDRFVRTAQLDLFMLAMSSIFMYSLFESALPAPWNWFQDTADWLLGDEKERDRAFFGAYPTTVAPLQMVTPPVARMLPATFKGIVEEDWSKMSDYVVWTMFPFGRIARDIAGPNSIIENPTRTVEKLTGLPYIQFGQQLKEERDKKTLHPQGLMNF